jgi:prolyl-tRNA synthetase
MLLYYEKVKEAYSKIFKRLGFNFKITEASGGVFTERHTHEFQVLCDTGEDTIYYCDKCNWSENSEIFSDDKLGACQKCKKGKIIKAKSIEVGNIFPLGTFYSERMRVYFTDKDGGKKPIWFASYGIGPTRVMGTLVEVSHDGKGLIWFPQIAPFDVHLLSLGKNKEAEEVNNKLTDAGIEVLFDDREVSAGEKFSDADLIGIPVRLVVSEKSGEKIEWKERTSDKFELIGIGEVIKRLQKPQK